MRADEQISSSVFFVRLITLQTYKLNNLLTRLLMNLQAWNSLT